MPLQVERRLVTNPAHKALWEKIWAGYRYISGKGSQQRADYMHFWPLVNKLYAMAHGEAAILPDELKIPLAFMLGAHAGRVRKGLRERPYFHHIIMVLYIVWLLDLPGDHQKAAIGHDDLEDLWKHLKMPKQEVAEEVAKLQGAAAFAIILNLTNVETPGSDKHASQLAKVAGMPALDALLKLVDRLTNMLDMRRDRPSSYTPRRIEAECRKAQELLAANPAAASDPIKALFAFAVEKLAKENDLAIEWA